MATGPAGDLMAEIQRYLDAVEYPTNRDRLLATATGQGASQQVISLLEALPIDEFGSAQDVLAVIQWRDALTT